MGIGQEFTWEVSLVGLSLTVFVLCNILTKSFKHKTDWLLCGWLVLLNIPLMHVVSSQLSINGDSFFKYTNPTLNLLHGPILLLYIRMLIQGSTIQFRKMEWLHLLPFALLYITFISVSHSKPMLPQPDKIDIQVFPLFAHFGVINVAFFVGYSIASILLLRKHQKEITGILSRNDNQVSLRWINALPALFAALVVINVAIENIESLSDFIHPLTLQMFSFLCFIILLSFFGVKQKPVFQFRQPLKSSVLSQEEADSKPAIVPDESDREDDEISDSLVEQVLKELEIYMRQEKPYLDPDFSVYALAEALSIPRRMLSMVLNKGLSKNFYQFVNEYRVEEVKSQLEDQNQTSTILDIAFQAGFKSKSSFNSLFKQYCNVTPSQYRKQFKG